MLKTSRFLMTATLVCLSGAGCQPTEAAAVDFLPADKKAIDILFRGYAMRDERIKERLTFVLTEQDTLKDFSICNRLGHNCKPPGIEVTDLAVSPTDLAAPSISYIRSDHANGSPSRQSIYFATHYDNFEGPANLLIDSWHHYKALKYRGFRTEVIRLEKIRTELEEQCGKDSFALAENELRNYSTEEIGLIAVSQKGHFPYIYSPFVIPLRAHKFTPDSQIRVNKSWLYTNVVP